MKKKVYLSDWESGDLIEFKTKVIPRTGEYIDSITYLKACLKQYPNDQQLKSDIKEIEMSRTYYVHQIIAIIHAEDEEDENVYNIVIHIGDKIAIWEEIKYEKPSK